jgi:hypothetical protein
MLCVRDAPAGTAVFEVDAAAAAGMVPNALEVVETGPGQCQLALAVVDHRDNDLGDYVETGVIPFVKPRGAGDDRVGTSIARLPVNQQFTCEAGRTTATLPWTACWFRN